MQAEDELTIEQRVKHTLDGFWSTAAQNVYSLIHHQPDLVIGLAHGGVLPTKGTAAVWSVLTDRPFPPIVYTNLGREKVRFYQDLCKKQGRYDFYGEHSLYTEALDFLRWLEGRDDWLNSLREQIELYIKKIPQSIVVVDEMSAQGNTRMLTLGLLEILYPQAVCQFLDGPYFEWRSQLSQYWLYNYHVDLYQQMKEEEANQQYEFRGSLYDIASGTEDVDAHLLSYRSLTHDNKAVAYLLQFLPFERWLEMPLWIEDLVIQHVIEQAKSTSLPNLMASYDWLDPHNANRLAPYLLLKHILRWGQITLSESSRLLGVPEAKVKEILDWLVVGTRYESTFLDVPAVVRMRTSAGVTYGDTETQTLVDPRIRESKRQRQRKWQTRPLKQRQRKPSDGKS